ncbi:MAG: DoxX family protein [Bryobacterales bacterium]|nr:DoxX family protein [Acidobacteriota bacterium]MCB9383132.1 DoxX family protein [Bryobacterales bacterium]
MGAPGFTHALLRIAAGLMFAPHGAQKLFGLWGRDAVSLASQSGVGGLIELFGGLLLVVGLFTRWTAFLCSGTMAVAFWQYHVAGSWSELGPSALHPLLNRGELAALYCFVFLFLWGNGAGPFSLDARRRK